MADYIERQAAIYTFYAFAPGIPWDTLDKIFNEIPSADVVEVVRCKDCIYWQDNNGGYPHEECRWGHDETPDADDYCSYGERKDDIFN